LFWRTSQWAIYFKALGKKAEDLLPLDHTAWDLEADYLALAFENLVCTLSPQKTILLGALCIKIIFLEYGES